MASKKRKASDEDLNPTSGVVQGARGDIGTGRMVVDKLAAGGSAEDAAARRRLELAGYSVPADTPMQIIHCDKGRGILANGFTQVFADVDGQKCRILDYAPTQSLQPHFHNADELFEIKGGRIKVFKWKDIDALSRGEPPVSAEWLGPGTAGGSTLAIPAGQPHCIHGHPETGVAFHELIGNFGARTTDFVKAEAEATNPVPRASKAIRPMWALGDDAELRAVSPAVRERFAEKVVLITGCSRGLGLGLVRHFVGAGAVVIATCRSPDRAPELAAAVKFAAVGSCVLPCDVSEAGSIAALMKAVKEQVLTEGQPLDVVVNVRRSSSLCVFFQSLKEAVAQNAGISSPNHPTDPILGASAADITSVFQTNVLGTVLLTQAALPLMEGGSKLVMNLSSQLGSIANSFGCQGRFGGVASYRISRAANNMAMRTFAGELSTQGFTFIAMSPGHVATDMGSAGGRKAPLMVGESVQGMLEVLAGTTTEDNGRFLQHDGAELPW